MFFVLQCVASSATEYHIASQKDFDRLKAATFQPGDLILFKRGVSFTGMFAPSGNGSQAAPIRVDVYGEGIIISADNGMYRRSLEAAQCPKGCIIGEPPLYLVKATIEGKGWDLISNLLGHPFIVLR